jgi:hypothetical protein
MVDQPPRMAMSVCAVMNCRWTGVMSLQVTTTNGSLSDVKMNSEHVEGLCYPLLFPHGEPGFTNEMKDCKSPVDYVMARMLMQEKIGHKYMTAPAQDFIQKLKSLIAILENHLLQMKMLIRLTSMPCKYLHANF